MRATVLTMVIARELPPVQLAATLIELGAKLLFHPHLVRFTLANATAFIQLQKETASHAGRSFARSPPLLCKFLG